jgi:hypothetical protein
MASISLSEYRTIVDFVLMFARSLRADNANYRLTAPCEHNAVDFGVNPAKRDEPKLALILAVIDALNNLIEKDCSGGQKRNPVLL